MRKFIIHSSKDKTSIMEVECIKLSPVECPVPGIKEGEWMGKIIKPESLLEKTSDGKLKEPVWCWWAFHASAEECLETLSTDARATIIRTKSKKRMCDNSEPELGTSTEEELAVLLSKIEIIML